ncbi:MAG: hypothetical protein ACP5U2_11260 [Bryobacteraceae bacterium]
MRSGVETLLRAALAVLLLAIPCAAAEGHGTSHGPAHVDLWKLANFVLFIGVLAYFLRKPAAAFFRGRTEHIQRAIADATRFQQEAERKCAEIEQRLAGVGAEIESLREQARQETAAEHERWRKQMELDVRKLQAEAEQEIAAMVKSARQRLRAEAAELAVTLAAEQIRQRLSPEIEDRWIQAMAEDLSRRKPGVG